MIHELILADGIDDFSKRSNRRKAARAATPWDGNLAYRAIIAPADEKFALEAISEIQHMEIDPGIIVA
jgi:hypothetical protein